MTTPGHYSTPDTTDSNYFESNKSTPLHNKHNKITPLISSIPNRIDQTQEEVIEP